MSKTVYVAMSADIIHPGSLLHFQYPLSLPAGAVKNGIIQLGSDKGKSLIPPSEGRCE